MLAGELRLYVEGGGYLPVGRVPLGKERAYTVRREAVLPPGDQRTLEPGLWHWLRADPDGAVALSISTCAHDVLDEFTDPDVVRTTRVAKETER